MAGRMREKRPGVWEVSVEAGRDPVTGRRRQLSRTVRGGKRDAQQMLNRLLSESDAGAHAGTDASFRDVALRWLRLGAGDLSPTTVRRYEGLLERHIYPSLGDRPAHKIRATELDDLYHGLVNEVGLAPATVRQVHAKIRRALSQAVKWGWIASNPAANTTPPRVKKPDIAPPSVNDVVRLIEAAHETNPAFARFLHVAVTTGARRGELCALRWERVDFERETLVIARSVIEVEGGLLEKDTKTHAIRQIALDSRTLDVLAQQRESLDELAAQVEVELALSSYVFTHDPAGTVPWTPDYVTKNFQRLRSSLGLERVRLHDLRHFAATSLLAAGVPVRTVAGRLGHANAATTLGVYAHFIEASDRDAAGVIGTLLR